MEQEKHPGTLNRYLGQMQAELGQTQRTLHQVLTEFLELKSQDPNLVERFEEVELGESETLTPELLDRHRNLLARLESLQQKALQNFSNPEEHPWKGFAHSGHAAEEFEPLIRSIRYASIQLNRFWVEVQSFPVFLNTLKNVSFVDLERIFNWVLTSPNWAECVRNPRLIPELANPESRKALMEFARDVLSVRALREQASVKVQFKGNEIGELDGAYRALARAASIAQKHRLESWSISELEQGCREAKDRLERVKKIQRFFADLSSRTQAPTPQNPIEASRVLQALRILERTPATVHAWRLPQILEHSQKIRIQTWQDRARPILETRKRLQARYRLDEGTRIDTLLKISEELKNGGWFRAFKGTYREAVQAYRALLKPELQGPKAKKHSRLQMIEGLTEWITWLEQLQAYNSNSEARAAFGPQFKGIDTDFASAREANAWAASVREELLKNEPGEDEEDVLGPQLVQYVFQLPPAQIQWVINQVQSQEVDIIQVLVDGSDIDQGCSFERMHEDREMVYEDWVELRSLLGTAGFKNGVAMIALPELCGTLEEVLFLYRRMMSNASAKDSLKADFAGIGTDLSVVEQAVAYVKFIQGSDIPEGLKGALLTAHGIQRLLDTRSLVERCLKSAASVRDHFAKLDVATRGQVQQVNQGQSWETMPVLTLFEKMQRALKHPTWLGDWVEYLRCQNEALISGLGPVLKVYERTSAPYAKLETAYNVAYNATLLKTALGRSSLSGVQAAFGPASS